MTKMCKKEITVTYDGNVADIISTDVNNTEQNKDIETEVENNVTKNSD